MRLNNADIEAIADRVAQHWQRPGRKSLPRPVEAVKRFAYTRHEAAESLGMSVDTFERRVQPFIKVIPCGSLVLVPPAELERWVAGNARLLV